MEKILKLSLNDLAYLLDEQKRITTEALLHGSSLYNSDNTPGRVDSIKNIDKSEFTKVGNKSSYPEDYKILKKYIA